MHGLKSANLHFFINYAGLDQMWILFAIHSNTLCSIRVLIINNPLVYYGLICLVSSSSFYNINILIGWKLWSCVVIGKKYVKFLAYPTQISCLEFLWHMHIVHIAINKVSRNLHQVSPLQSSFVHSVTIKTADTDTLLVKSKDSRLYGP